MDIPRLDRLISMRRFPPVVHPRHARELLAGACEAEVAEWTGGYAITLPEHRQLLEDLLGSLAWRPAGCAALINGLYGTGKSHLLVLLHLLSALPASWTPFLETHPIFRRFALPMQAHRRLILHFSLDEYGPRLALEDIVLREAAQALEAAQILVPDAWQAGGSRLDAWSALLDAMQAHGYDGLLLLVDELSLFLAGKSPARREADAAFLQFLAGLTARAPVWLVGALQRNLSDVGALRTHSWRQVEDRFRRYTLSPQEIGRVLCNKLLRRDDPAAIRALVIERILPAAASVGYSAAELHASWPFHPEAVELLLAVTNNHLSPHRSAVELLQRIGDQLPERPADRLITPLELLELAEDDLRGQAKLARCWSVAHLLAGWAERAPDPALARQAVRLLTLLHLAELTAPVSRLRALLFDGTAAPAIDVLSTALHAVRRLGAHLALARDADPAAEVFTLAVDDETGVLASLRMQEMRREFTPDDARVIELALQCCIDPAWPFGVEESRLFLPWRGSERPALLTWLPVLSMEAVARAFEALPAGKADAQVLLHWPGAPADLSGWRQATALLAGPHAGTLLLWLPRSLRPAEHELWTEYAAWLRAARDAAPPVSAREKRARQRCQERADELRPAVEASVRAVYQDGQWLSARGDARTPVQRDSLAAGLAEMLAPGFDALFPGFPAGDGVPSRAALQLLTQQIIEPGEAHFDPHSLLGDYLNRFALPLGCAEVKDAVARVTPPHWELLAPLLAQAAAGPLRLPDALHALQCPPLGLSAEQARLVVFAAARTGALQPLDGFVQPLDPAHLPLSRSDALVFLGVPTAAHPRHHALIRMLAAHWELPDNPWPLACSQVERRLRAWITAWTPRIPELRGMMAEWGERLQTAPWAWQASERALAALDAMQSGQLDALLDALGDGEAIGALAALDLLATWWRARKEQVFLLSHAPGGVAPTEIAWLREQLSRGEGCAALLVELDARLAHLLDHYTAAYRRWHADAFGEQAVMALRAAFETAEFRAVKLLARLPLAPPASASRCLELLAQARANFCPGLLARLAEEGCCARCRLPLDSPSPLPDPATIRALAEQGVREYADLTARDPWFATIHERLSRAPADIAPRVAILLGWCLEHGARPLLDALDDRTLAWLCRDQRPAGQRHTAQVRAILHGRELTLAEARGTLLAWLDPQSELSDDAVLLFE